MGGLRHWLDVAGEYGLSARAWQFRRCAQVAGATDIASAQKQSLPAEPDVETPSGAAADVPSVMASDTAWFFPLCGSRRIVVMFAPPANSKAGSGRKQWQMTSASEARRTEGGSLPASHTRSATSLANTASRKTKLSRSSKRRTATGRKRMPWRKAASDRPSCNVNWPRQE